MTRGARRRLLSPRIGTATRLAGVYAVVLGAVLAGTVVAFLHTTRVGIDEIAVQQLGGELSAFQRALDGATKPPGSELQSFATSYLRSHAVADGDLVELAVPGRWAVANAGGSKVAADARIADLTETVPPRTRVSAMTVGGRRLEVLVAPIKESGSAVGLFLASVDTSAFEPAVRATEQISIGESAIALVAGVASTYLVLRRLLRRIGSIAETADRIGRDQLHERLGDQGTSDEVAELAHSFDGMLDRIESSVKAQHELLSDVSHQLRTPLTVARGHLEVLQRTGGNQDDVEETTQVAIAEMDRMARLTDRLLELGRAREPVRHDVRPVDLRSFMGDLLRAGRALAERDWQLTVVPDAVASFDEPEVRGAVLNLMDNACRATTAGQPVRLGAAVLGDEVAFRVDDAGPGIPPDDRRRLLERFSRQGAAGKGTGLGLAIVDAVARAHGGSVTIGESPFGGASVTMTVRSIGGIPRTGEEAE